MDRRDDVRNADRNAEELAVPFIFVPHGEEPPAAWLAEHPGAVRFPATLKPRGSGGQT